ncbi:tetraacyldisaccharide 4'-kinase [Porphyromonas pogonae]|uniref:tetraacyldisaccharide 4'-kinase n=1 Tax=Porphyromonas pogonae TaxID=867595 RepID=UPI002E775FC7|nr:tetraacyldisaccharide 4'-kinase [Porphyromonas pogonae]
MRKHLPATKKTWFRPLSSLYGAAVKLRNMLFDQGVIKSHTYPIPLICVGNLSVGGSGKTPHVELLLRKLTPKHKIAVISRGYKRSTKGLIIATPHSTAKEIGDEPKQIVSKFPGILMVLDGNRRRAMEYLLNLPKCERPDIVIMDDGFQHRYVRPSFSIILSDYNNPLISDSLLPEGTLREPASSRYRADAVIVTKCPQGLQPIDTRIARRDLALYPDQYLFFSHIVYGDTLRIQDLAKKVDPPPDISQEKIDHPLSINHQTPVIALSGIAKPELFQNYLRQHYNYIEEINYGDHHQFCSQDIKHIHDTYHRVQQQNDKQVIIITTEKDAVRLADILESFDKEVVSALYYLPIEVKILRGWEDSFNRMLDKAVKLTPYS